MPHKFKMGDVVNYRPKDRILSAALEVLDRLDRRAGTLQRQPYTMPAFAQDAGECRLANLDRLPAHVSAVAA
jgi:hypothetical protein